MITYRSSGLKWIALGHPGEYPSKEIDGGGGPRNDAEIWVNGVPLKLS